MRISSKLVMAAAVTGVLSLAGCSSGADEYCSTLRASVTGATLFSAHTAWGGGSNPLDQRLQLMDAAEDTVPEDLADDWAVWRTHVEAVRDYETGESPMPGLADDPEADAAREAGSRLGTHYVDTCF